MMQFHHSYSEVVDNYSLSYIISSQSPSMPKHNYILLLSLNLLLINSNDYFMVGRFHNKNNDMYAALIKLSTS